MPALHVSAGARSVERWLERGRSSAAWALGLAAIDEALYLWHSEGAIRLLGDPPSRQHPEDVPELEDFVEASIKAARGMRQRDPVALRLHARIAAEFVPRLLLRLNASVTAYDRRDALRLALGFPRAPDGYRADMETCLGVRMAGDGAVGEAVERLSLGVLAFLRIHDPEIDPQPGVAECLQDGALERHVAQAFEASRL